MLHCIVLSDASSHVSYILVVVRACVYLPEPLPLGSIHVSWGPCAPLLLDLLPMRPGGGGGRGEGEMVREECKGGKNVNRGLLK